MTTPFPFVANTILTAAQLNAVTTLPIAAKTANYVLAVGDVGYRVQMTAAGATTITVNTGIFSAGDTIWIQNMGAGTCTITAGTATVGTASSLALAQYGGGTLVFQSASAATFFSQQAATYGAATGGDVSSSITVGGINYTLLTFNNTGTLTVTKAGLFDLFLVGGGGAGKSGVTFGGGGGAGQVLETTAYFSANQTITIAAASATDVDGVATYVGTALFAAGGAFGGNLSVGNSTRAGASGGGANAGSNTGKSPLVSGVSGFKGGDNTGVTSAAGGGGFGAVGANSSGTTGGAGGTGYDASAFRGEVANTTRLAGGGGGAASVTQGAGTDGGGAGGAATGVAATANKGGGGGGGGSGAGGAGGKGVVYVRFKS